MLVAPKVENIEIRDWKAYAPAKLAGREAMMAALAGLSKPITDLRRRPSLAEQEAEKAGGFNRRAASPDKSG